MDYIGAIGPASTQLPHNTLEGYQPVSRNGEVTQNAFVDGFAWNKIHSQDSTAKTFDREGLMLSTGVLEDKAPFHEWASVQPGHICVFEKDRSTRYRHHTATETAAPVIACAQWLTNKNDKEFAFAGVARSVSHCDYDDIANGRKRDEFFTLHIGGPVTVLNNGNNSIHMGDPVEWTFMDKQASRTMPQRKKGGPRRIQIRKATTTHARVFGRALNFAKRGESVDVRVGSGAM